MTVLKIKQLDTWVFKTQRPFTFGEDTFSEVIFPPTPSTVYGAIRSMVIFNREGGIEKFKEGYKDIGNPKEYGSFEIKYICITGNLSRYWAVPSDILFDEKNKKGVYLRTHNLKHGIFDEGYLFDNILINTDIANDKETKDGFISNRNLSKYFKGDNLQSENSVIMDVVDRHEFKTGIARDKVTHTTMEGYLYRIPHTRLKNGYYLEIGVESLNIGEKNMIMKLGGEGKAGLVSIENSELPQFNYPDEDVEYIKLYLITPAIFEKGRIPDIFDDNYNAEIKGIKMKLVAVSMKKPFWISGWDLYRKTPKPAYKAIPAGSVYYFKLDNKMNIKDIADKLNYSSLCKGPFSKEGYGRVLVGKVKI